MAAAASTDLPSLPTPTPRAERLPALDALRGFALAGILVANLPLFAGHPYMSDAALAALPTAALDGVVSDGLELLVENKFMGLFAVLFGLGVALQLGRARDRGGNGVRLHLRRMGWLFALGAVHGWLLWGWDVLRFYALWGLLLPLFARLRSRALLAAGVTLAVLVPAAWRAVATALAVERAEPEVLAAFASGGWLDALAANWAYDWYLTLSPSQGAYQAGVVGRILVGFWLGRRLLATGLPSPATLGRAAAALLPLGLAGSAVFAGLFEVPVGGLGRRLLVETGTLALTLAYLAAFLRAWQSSAARRPLSLLVPVGRMSLSSYLLQTAIGLWLFYGFLPGPALAGRLGVTALLPIWAAVYAAQVAFAHLWLRRFAYGPVEWLWRSLAYGAPQPWRLAPAPASRGPAPSAVT